MGKCTSAVHIVSFLEMNLERPMNEPWIGHVGSNEITIFLDI